MRYWCVLLKQLSLFKSFVFKIHWYFSLLIHNHSLSRRSCCRVVCEFTVSPRTTNMGKKDKSEQSMFTKEEEQLLSDFSRNVSTKSSALFYGSAFMVSALPICKQLFFFQKVSLKTAVAHRFVHRALLENTHDRNDAGPRLVRSRHVRQHVSHCLCL